MGRKLNLMASLFSKPNNNNNGVVGGGDNILITTPSSSSSLSSSSSWAWPLCHQPKTESFRSGPNNNIVYKTINSIYFDSATTTDLSLSEDLRSDGTSSACCGGSDDESEAVIRGLIRSDRLFFDPHSQTSSILERQRAGHSQHQQQHQDQDQEAEEEEQYGPSIPFKESVAMAMESDDPYGDFRRSMEEMVAAHGITGEWDRLEELLLWYLRVNGKPNHGFIVGAFVDLLVALASAADGDRRLKDGGPSCSFSNHSMSSMSFEIEEIEEIEEGNGSC